MNKKVAVLGPIPRDTISTHKKKIIKKYGCATHTSIALSNLLGNQGTVYPVTYVQKVDKGAINNVFKPYRNINTQYISDRYNAGDVIHLQFQDQNFRKEKQIGFMRPILPEDVKGVLDADLFVCVPVTDFEIPLSTLQYIKANSKGLVVFDAHGPTSSVSTSGERFMKYWLTRDEWLPYIDVLKMNLEEAYCSWFKYEYSFKELQKKLEISLDQLPAFAKHCLNKGLKALYITLDENGVLAYYKENGKIVEKHVAPIPVTNVIDTTGCGDSFAGGLGYGLLHSPTNYVEAAKYANAMGAQRTQGTGFDVFKPLKETQAQLRRWYDE